MAAALRQHAVRHCSWAQPNVLSRSNGCRATSAHSAIIIGAPSLFSGIFSQARCATSRYKPLSVTNMFNQPSARPGTAGPTGRPISPLTRRLADEQVTRSTVGSLPQRAVYELGRFAEGSAFTSVFQRLRGSEVERRLERDRRQQEDLFQASQRFLMAPERWTFGNMLAYHRKLLELVGGTGWRRRMNSDGATIAGLDGVIQVLEAMSPVELASNHKSIFTSQAIDLIAEKSGKTREQVREVIYNHDRLRGDRRWYMILEQFGKPLPKTFDDYQFKAEYDRPWTETEWEQREAIMAKQMRIYEARSYKPPKITHLYFRRPSVGGNRWSTQPPRWYPARWRMRPEARSRLLPPRPARSSPPART